MTTRALIDKMLQYTAMYSEPPYGREIAGTAELLLDAASRLIDFEKSGLTPEEISELARAKREDRLVELPYALGGTVYTLEKIECGNYCDCWVDDLGCNGARPCPLRPVGHKVEGYEVSLTNDGELVLSDPGKWGHEGLETFSGINGVIYNSPEGAKIAAEKYNAPEEGKKE